MGGSFPIHHLQCNNYSVKQCFNDTLICHISSLLGYNEALNEKCMSGLRDALVDVT